MNGNLKKQHHPIVVSRLLNHFESYLIGCDLRSALPYWIGCDLKSALSYSIVCEALFIHIIMFCQDPIYYDLLTSWLTGLHFPDWLLDWLTGLSAGSVFLRCLNLILPARCTYESGDRRKWNLFWKKAASTSTCWNFSYQSVVRWEQKGLTGLSTTTRTCSKCKRFPLCNAADLSIRSSRMLTPTARLTDRPNH